VLIAGDIHPAVTNVGLRPTFARVSPRPVVESHIFDLDRDLYGLDIKVAFVQRLRDEVAFPDGDALRAQIARDCEQARALFRQISL
jgi:riboflavin kinase/FMN adenylyltransferase